MLKHKAALVPTLTPMRRILMAAPEAGIPDYAVEKMQRVSEKWLQSFREAVAGRRAHRGGHRCRHAGQSARFGRGRGEVPGGGGIQHVDALRSATTTAASVIGLDGQRGLRAPGSMWADLIFVKGDPLADISALDALCGVMKDGELVWFDRDAVRPG